jgi:hypothetical protein
LRTFSNWVKHFIHSFSYNRSIISGIHKKIKPGQKDTLFVFTEFVLANQIIIKQFRNKGAKIYLLEDGMGTIYFFNLPPEKLSKRLYLNQIFIRYFYGIKGFRFLKADSGHFEPVMADSHFSGVCLFLNASIKRNIPVYQLNKHTDAPRRNLDSTKAVFLNEGIYYYYESFEKYIQNLDIILSHLSKNFNEIYFKFHPDEKELEKIKTIREVVLRYSNIKILENSKIIEDIILELNCKYAVSYYCSALKNLLFYNVEPVFIFHLLDSFPTDLTTILGDYLKKVGYNFPQSFEEIKPGYNSGILDKINTGLNIEDLLSKS